MSKHVDTARIVDAFNAELVYMYKRTTNGYEYCVPILHGKTHAIMATQKYLRKYRKLNTSQVEVLRRLGASIQTIIDHINRLIKADDYTCAAAHTYLEIRRMLNYWINQLEKNANL